ncbi:hypothetical protein SAMN04489723_109136 [Algoriphagus aquimarinus]|uniref:Uncharacterized protein n=1 Tax=Algoriphagus aquimarinus TaxID=237018 RepID=A0A1I1AVW3_9BACT|nr:hypothetical protein SAMN04489723_109136 [Algoriphagus aquimarinus]
MTEQTSASIIPRPFFITYNLLQPFYFIEAA